MLVACCASKQARWASSGRWEPALLIVSLLGWRSQVWRRGSVELDCIFLKHIFTPGFRRITERVVNHCCWFGRLIHNGHQLTVVFNNSTLHFSLLIIARLKQLIALISQHLARFFLKCQYSLDIDSLLNVSVGPLLVIQHLLSLQNVAQLMLGLVLDFELLQQAALWLPILVFLVK